MADFQDGWGGGRCHSPTLRNIRASGNEALLYARGLSLVAKFWPQLLIELGDGCQKEDLWYVCQPVSESVSQRRKYGKKGDKTTCHCSHSAGFPIKDKGLMHDRA